MGQPIIACPRARADEHTHLGKTHTSHYALVTVICKRKAGGWFTAVFHRMVEFCGWHADSKNSIWQGKAFPTLGLVADTFMRRQPPCEAMSCHCPPPQPVLCCCTSFSIFWGPDEFGGLCDTVTCRSLSGGGAGCQLEIRFGETTS